MPRVQPGPATAAVEVVGLECVPLYPTLILRYLSTDPEAAGAMIDDGDLPSRDAIRLRSYISRRY